MSDPQPAFACDYQRLWDLVRHQRSELLDAELITRDEYVALLADETKDRQAQGSPSPRRLESYDELRARLSAFEGERDALKQERDDIRQSIYKLTDDAGISFVPLGVNPTIGRVQRAVEGMKHAESALADAQREHKALEAASETQQLLVARKDAQVQHAMGEIQTLTQQLADAQEEITRLERAYRQELWLGHGHQGIYGDDGEMQCAECMPFGCWDYKRDPLEAVVEAASKARMQRVAKAWEEHQAKQSALSPQTEDR